MSVLHNEGLLQIADPDEERSSFMSIAPDRRADSGMRRVCIARRRVLIERRVAGIDMHISIASSAFRGVALSIVPTGSGAPIYRVRLVHHDNDLDVDLYVACHDHDVVAEWQAWAAHLALPKLIERSPERFETAEAQLGSVAIGRGLRLRRRGATISKRRPRIYLRRFAPPPGPQYCFKGEREIIAYD